jgi:uncharacterized protein YndB with AHSA1/START domain
MEMAVRAKTEMLIRAPAAKVFSAWADPAITRHFWFTTGTGTLGAGKSVQWRWDMYGFSVNVDVKVFDEPRRIVVEWGAPGKPPTTVEWTFDDRPDGTFVHIVESGFRGEPDEIVQAALNSTEGFTFVVAALKAWLEHGVELGVVRDRHPDGLPASENEAKKAS